MKNSRIALLIALPFATATHQSSLAYTQNNYIYGQSALGNYVSQCINHLFYPKHEYYEIKQLCSDVTRTIFYDSPIGQYSWYHGTYFDANLVYEAIIGEVVTFVEFEAKKHGSASAATRIRNEVLQLVSGSSNLPMGVLADFVGSTLHNKLQQLTAATSWSNSEIKEFVNYCVDRMLLTYNQTSSDRNDINIMKNSIINNLVATFGNMPFDRTRAYNGIVNTVIDFIEHRASCYARQATANNTIASKVVKRIRDEVLKIITESSYIDNGSLAEYIGASLRTKINELLNRFDAPYSQYANVKLYPSQECCICLEAFSAHVEQLFLMPCGHDMCKQCAYSHFFQYNNAACPQCRSIVDKMRLQEVINQ